MSHLDCFYSRKTHSLQGITAPSNTTRTCRPPSSPRIPLSSCRYKNVEENLRRLFPVCPVIHGILPSFLKALLSAKFCRLRLAGHMPNAEISTCSCHPRRTPQNTSRYRDMLEVSKQSRPASMTSNSCKAE
jgi:hypothetical protein